MRTITTIKLVRIFVFFLFFGIVALNVLGHYPSLAQLPMDSMPHNGDSPLSISALGGYSMDSSTFNDPMIVRWFTAAQNAKDAAVSGNFSIIKCDGS